MPGQPRDGDVGLRGQEEVGGAVPGHVDPPSGPDTAQQSDLQSGGVHGPRLLDGDQGRVLDDESCVAVTSPGLVLSRAGVEASVLPRDGGQQVAAVPPPLHVDCDPRPGPGHSRRGVT